MQAVILAGGLGTRLRPLTYDIPKPMIPINGKPYLEYQLDYLRKQGITNILILIGYLGDHIVNYFGDGTQIGMNIQYSKEETPLGTGGGLKKAQGLLADEFILIYGDSFLPIDYSDLIQRYQENQSMPVMCVYDNSKDTDVICNIAINDADNKVLKYVKNSSDDTLRFVDAGVLLLNKQVLEYLPEEGLVSLEQQVFPLLIEDGKLFAYISSERFYDIGTHERLDLAMEVFR